MHHRVLVALVLIIAVIMPLSPALATDCDGTITALGVGKTQAKPDVAFVTLHVQGAGLLMEDAYRDAAAKADAITKAIRDKHGADAIGGLSSARCTNEENYAFQKFIRAGVGTNNVDHCARL